MADLWHYTREGRPMEPVPTAEIQRLAREGLLKSTDLVWREGLPSWIRADAAAEIFAMPALALDHAPGAIRPGSLPREPRSAFANEPSTRLDEPILLEPIDGAAQPGDSAHEPRLKRRRWDGQGEPNLGRRRLRRDRHRQMVILWIGLLIAGGVLLVVLVLGMFYIAISAL